MFSFAMSKEQKMVKNEFAKFVKEKVTDAAHDMDEDGKSRMMSFKKSGNWGLLFP